ncbi:asparaginase [Jannaschia sp. 2305UL9-9]|uniref:asparaginase n=1 Tax=Jannaschia sp. 2305UL9-9 TaxID=3121638 RepID=UPI00352719B1
MATDTDLVQIIRGDHLESAHRGQAVICDGSGQVIEAWGDAERVLYPRSSAKMIQALPLLESGAGRSLTDRHLAFACASHRGQAIHTELAAEWLADLGASEDDLRCGSHAPFGPEAAADLIRSGESPCQLHNNCSGKHCGFVTVARHLGAGPEYIEPDHPVQKGALAALEEVTGVDSPYFCIDGCSAPNHATRLDAFAGAMGRFARARAGGDTRSDAMARLVKAMASHPDLVSGAGGADTRLMQAMGGAGVVKTGAEGVYIAILPELDRGIALKISDGTTRASEALIAALLVHVGALPADAPVVKDLTHGPMCNARGLVVGHMAVTL